MTDHRDPVGSTPSADGDPSSAPSPLAPRHAETRYASRWTVVAFGYAAIVGACLGYSLLGFPVQVTDSLGPLLDVTGRSLSDLLSSQIHEQGYFRPMRWVNIWTLATVSAGDYYAWFRGWHVAQAVVLVVLFVRLLRPVAPVDAAVVPLGLSALLGMHTFTGLVNEAFPVNHFMTVAVCCLLAAELTSGPPRWWRNVGAWAVCAFAALTLETGLLVPVVVVAASLCGARGVSRWGVAGSVVLVAAYLVVRFGVLDTGTPGLTERNSGFGFSTLTPDDLVERFGDNPWPFHLYNVVTSAMSVFLTEPRAGRWEFLIRVVGGSVRVIDVVEIAASLTGTTLIVWYAWRRRRAWRARRFDRDDQLLLLLPAVTMANAVLSYAYQKDVIMSPSGIFFALALAVAARAALTGLPVPAWRAGGVAVVLFVLSTTWTIRAVGLHVGLRLAATQTRNEWAYVDRWLEDADQVLSDPEKIRVKAALQADAVSRHPERPAIGRWTKWFAE